MNNKQPNITKLFIATFTSIFIASCAAPSLVAIEEPIEQLKNLEDYDSDGVIEERDKCPSTVLGAIIDNYGCGTQTPLIEPFKIDIKFANNSYTIPSSAYGKIKDLAAFLDKNEELLVRIEGHTSNVGDRELNQTLSENRAKAVAFVLVNDFNINEERVSSAGFGFDRLEEEGDTPSAHAINRRIMAELTKTSHIDNMQWTIYTVNQAL